MEKKFKTAVISYPHSNNLGDYIQKIAAKQFLKEKIIEIDRDNLNNYIGEKIKLIINGWFMEKPNNWPPSNKIIPFFISFHINPIIEKYILNKNGVEYLKKHEPIGCRDLYTKSIPNPEILISVAGNEIFKKPLINLAPLGCLNLHTALLPKYRGLMPSFWVLKNKEKFTGVSVFYVDEGIDSGPIITQTKIPIENFSQDELIRKSKKVGMQAIIESLIKIKNGNVILQENNAEEMTYFSFPTKKDVYEFYSNGAKFF